MSPAVQTVALDTGLCRSVFANGLAVVTERMPDVRSVAIGIWVRTASGHEPRAKMGVSHLLEHMVFKGTERRSARDIALALEARGGSLDAFTSRDHTSFQAHVLDADLALALDVLTDLVRRPLLRPEDLELERNVVLEELNGVFDAPDDLVGELWGATLWPEHPYGYSILGTPATVQALEVSDLRRVHREGYYPGNMIIAIAGRLEHDQVVERLEELGWLDGQGRPPRSPAAAAVANRGVLRHEPRDLQQVHAMIGTDTVDAADPRRWGLALLATALGGGMSSRLFQRVREELGLCYAVSAWHTTYRAAGVFGIYVGTQLATARSALSAIGVELQRLATDGLPAAELADAKGQLRGQVLLALESTTSRMGRAASHLLYEEPYRTVEEVLGLIDGVTPEQTAGLAGEFLAPERMTTVRLGPAD
jgi:predicted Zn-dependent peptidase